MYKHSAFSSVVTPGFSSFLSLPSLCFLLHPSQPHLLLSLSLSSSVFCLYGHPRSKFACRVMKSHKRAPVPAEHTLPSFECESHVRTFLMRNTLKTQAHFPINNACWAYCSGRSTEGWVMGGKTQRRILHIITQNKIFQFASQMEVQLCGDDPVCHLQRAEIKPVD